MQVNFNSCPPPIAHIYVGVVTKETVLALQQVGSPSHLQNNEQASCPDEHLHICQEHGMSMLQLLLINISERTTSTLLGSDTGQYAPGGHSDVQSNNVY